MNDQTVARLIREARQGKYLPSLEAPLRRALEKSVQIEKLREKINTVDEDLGKVEDAVFDNPHPSERDKKRYAELVNQFDSLSDQLDSREGELGKQSMENSEKVRARRILVYHQVDFLQRTLQVNRSSPAIRKGKWGGREFYSLWINNVPALLCKSGDFQYLRAARKDKPLELLVEEVPAQTLLIPSQLQLLKDGNLYDSSLRPLYGYAEEIAAGVFLQVINGKLILPAPDKPEGYVVRGDTKPIIDTEPQYRHWGQVHLAKLNPERVTDGKLLGSGGSYKAFVYGGKTVVEFDQPDHATYLFDTSDFEILSVWNRSKILETNPNGFRGRILHHEDRGKWRTLVERFIE